MQTGIDEIFGMTQELPCEGNDEVGGVATFLLLHLAGHDHHLGGGMLHLQLSQDGGGVARNEGLVDVVDDHLLHAVRSQRLLDHVGDLLDVLNILQHNFLEAGKVFVALLEKVIEAV